MTTLDTVRRLIGRRSKITRQEMADILEALGRDGLSLENGYVPGTTPAHGSWQAAHAWANTCRDITCISVSGRGLRDGYVRYDEPGSMHPMQHAEITFVPADIDAGRNDGGSTIEYMRQHADRVLLVRDDPPLVDSPSHKIRAQVDDWCRERNECAEDRIHTTDSRHAYRLGLHVLSQLTRLRGELEQARGPMSAGEVIARLAPIIHLATGEAQDKLRALAGDETIEIPGIPAYMRASIDEDDD